MQIINLNSFYQNSIRDTVSEMKIQKYYKCNLFLTCVKVIIKQLNTLKALWRMYFNN